MQTTQLIRKSPAVLAIKVIIAEVILELLYGLIYVLLVVAENQNILASTSSLRLALTFVNAVAAFGLFAVIFAVWTAEGVIVAQNELIEKHGVLRSQTTSYPYANMQRVTVQQSVIGKIGNFGTITIYMPVLGKDIIFSDYSNPYQLAETIKASIPNLDKQQFLIRR